MPEGSSFRQVDEKHVSSEVELMSWSPKMDLLAVANVQGEVVLHRLSWQKVWNRTALTEGDKVKSLAWRPDGKILAIGYSSGQLILCDIEDCTITHTSKLLDQVTSMSWIEKKTSNETDTKNCDISGFNISLNESDEFLPRLPPFNKNYTAKGQNEETYEDMKKLKNQKELNLLVAGTKDGKVHIFAYGVFPVGVIDLQMKALGIEQTSVKTAYLSHDLYLLTLLVDSERQSDGTKKTHLVSFDTTLLASRHEEIKTLALKFGQVLGLMSYLSATITQMTEAWENILMEMDSKLKTFADEKFKVCGGSVSNDFLRLLMIGIPSEELQQFLIHQLTEKGLKKFGHSIETSYSNIQKLVLKHLQSVGQALVYHLADIRGMAQWYDKYGVLGLTLPTIDRATSVCGAFMLKASELQQVIDGSMKNFKAFFRWLYVVIQRLSGEPIPPELSKMTQQDLNFVAQFLSENFTEEKPEEGKSGFKLELVGQYLRNENLSNPPDNSGNPWVQFLEQDPNLKDSRLLYKPFPEKSLLQVHEMVSDSFEEILYKCASVIGESFHYVTNHCLFSSSSSESPSLSYSVSQISKSLSEDTEYLYTVLTAQNLPSEKCYLIRQTTTSSDSRHKEQVVCFNLGRLGSNVAQASLCESSDQDSDFRCDRHLVLDVAFYDPDTLALLLQEDSEDSTPVLTQLSLSPLTRKLTPLEHSEKLTIGDQYTDSHDVGSDVEDLNFRRLENMRASEFSVSGSRNVACVLFSSRRRVRLFMMDAEDEDDEDENQDADTTLDTSTIQEEEIDEQEGGQGDTSQGDISQDLSTDREQLETSVEENKENAS